MAQTEKGTTGLKVFSGIVQDEFLTELRGKEGLKRYDEMRRNSAVVGAMLYYHEMAVRKVSWNFSNKASKLPDERVDFLNECREGMAQSWNEFISEVLSFMWAGYSLFWVNYKRDKDTGSLMWDTFSPRKQNTVFQWLLNYPGTSLYDPNKRNGEILGFIQQAPPVYKMETLLSERLLHFRTRVEANNPEGISLLRNAWVSYYYAKNLQATEAIGYERDLNGLPVVGMPQGAGTDVNDPNSDASKAAEIVRNVRNDEQGGVVKPYGWEFSLLSGSGKGFADIGRTIERYEARILMSMLSQFIMLGQSGVGSLALSKDSTSIAEMIVNATADIIAETFTQQEIPRILRLNGWDADDICLEHTPAGDTDISKYADFLQKVGEKFTWDASDEVWLRQLAGMPEKTEEDIAASMAKAQAVKVAAAKAFAQRVNPQSQNQDGNPPTPQPQDSKQTQPDNTMPAMDMKNMQQENSAMQYAAKPLDDYQRRRIEKQVNDALLEVQNEQKKRILKWARERSVVRV